MRQTIVLTLLVLSSMAAAQVKDYHAHAIPDSYRELVAKHNMLLDEGFPLPQWSAEAHVQMMSEAGIDRAILTIPAPHPYFGDQTECNTACRQLNEELARLAASYENFQFAESFLCRM